MLLLWFNFQISLFSTLFCSHFLVKKPPPVNFLIWQHIISPYVSRKNILTARYLKCHYFPPTNAKLSTTLIMPYNQETWLWLISYILSLSKILDQAFFLQKKKDLDRQEAQLFWPPAQLFPISPQIPTLFFYKTKFPNFKHWVQNWGIT